MLCNTKNNNTRLFIHALPLSGKEPLFLRRWSICIVASFYMTQGIAATIDTRVQDAQSAQELQLRQQREQMLRQQQEPKPDVRLPQAILPIADTFPQNEAPCFTIAQILLTGEAAEQFQFALKALITGENKATGRCLGTQGMNVAITRAQNAIIAQGFVTTRVLVAPQDLSTGTLTLTVIPGRIRNIHFSPDSSQRGNAWNALPMHTGDILNLRDIEQGLENFKRVPTAEADFKIEPAEDRNASPGESDLLIQYKQRFPLRLTLSADDAGFKSTGKYQGGVTLSGDNLLTLNDLFYANWNHDLGGGDSGSRGSKGYALHYSLPYGYWQLAANTSKNNYHQKVTGINQSYIYSGESENYSLRLSRMVFRNAVNKTTLSFGGFLKKSSNFINDTEIEVQRRRTAGWELGFNQAWYLGNALLDYEINYRRGTGAFGALPAPEQDFGEGTSRFEVLTTNTRFSLPFAITLPWSNAQHIQPMRYSMELRTQHNQTPLTPQERFSIGSRYTVRGFDGQQTLLAERGWLIRNEITTSLGASNQNLYLGADYGEVSGQSSDNLLGKQLAGGVIGLRGSYKGMSYDVFTGQALHKPNGFETANTTAGFNLNWSL